MESKRGKHWFYWFTFAVAVIFVYKTLDSWKAITDWLGGFFSLLMPFILAILVAYIFYLPAKKLENLFQMAPTKWVQKHARTFSVLGVYLVAFIILAVIIKFLVPSVSKSVIELVENLPGYYQSATQYLNELPEDSILNKVDVKGMIHNLQQIEVSQFLQVDNLSGYAKGVIGIATGIFDLFVMVIVSIYILLERKQILQFASKLSSALFKGKANQKIRNYFRKTNEIFYQFIFSQMLDAVVVGTIMAVALSIMKVKYGVLLGIMIGVFNIIPYFGAIIAVVIAVLITIFTGGIPQALAMLVVVIVLQQIDANIINPKIVGSTLKLSPILIIFAVTVGEAYFGILGMFLSVPIVAMLKILILDYVELKNMRNIQEQNQNE